MKAPWYMRDARIERGPDGPRMTFRPHPLWLAWLALCVAAKRGTTSTDHGRHRQRRTHTARPGSPRRAWGVEEIRNMIIAPTNTRAANTPKPVVCRPGQNVSERAREAFGERAAVCVTTGAGDRPVIGRVATRWSGPFFDVVES